MHFLGLIKHRGGAGATTTAVHLALAAARAGRRPVIADTDSQQSAVAWWKARENDDIPVVLITADQIKQYVKAAENARYDLVLVDTAPVPDQDFATAARANDLWVPRRASGSLGLRRARLGGATVGPQGLQADREPWSDGDGPDG